MRPALAAVLLCALVLVGCAGGPAASWLALVLAFALVACSTKTSGNSSGTDAQGSDVPAAEVSDGQAGDSSAGDTTGSDLTGSDSLVSDGVVSDGQGADLSDSADSEVTAVDISSSDTGLDATADIGPDSIVSDVGDSDVGDSLGDGGAWEPCCQNGKVSTCFCPANTECNYGMFTSCGDGSCVLPPGACPTAPDATDADSADVEEGTWDPCCLDGKVSTCFCPAGVACNYGMFTDCGDGSCTMFGQTCP